MIKQKDSAEVLETAYSDVMNVAQRQQVLFEIYAPELADIPDAKPVHLKANTSALLFSVLLIVFFFHSQDIFARGDVLRNNRFCDDIQKLVDKWCSKV